MYVRCRIRKYERMERSNPLLEKSYAFSLSIIALFQLLQRQREYVLSKQVLSSGTSIGANIEEAQQAQTRKDFISKMSIAAKEAYETRYWLRLLRDSKIPTMQQTQELLSRVDEIIRMLVATLKTSKTSP